MAKHRYPDPDLDPFRDGVAALSREGIHVGHVASVVEPLWGPARPFGRQERVWLLVT